MAWRSWRSSLSLAPLGAMVGMVALGILLAGTSEAKIRTHTITPEVDTGLRIQTGGRNVSMTGPMACDRGENWEVQVNLSQKGTRGEGRSEGVCRGEIQEWVTRIAAQGSATFTTGAARGCALLRTIKDSTETDRHE